MIEILQVDAFTLDEDFSGNPAAVVFVDRDVDPTWCSGVAAEMNLSETAFVRERADGCFDLRWFTPTVEVELCGHATLASAHAIWETGRSSPDRPIEFVTRFRGGLTATRPPDGIEIALPRDPARPADRIPALEAALGIDGEIVGVAHGTDDLILELDSVEAVREVVPDFPSLTRATDRYRGVIVTADAREHAIDADFVSRFFGPWVGVDEDPVTGSAHALLAGYWAEHWGPGPRTALQLSARGGRLRVELDGDRVRLRGTARTVFRGHWVAPEPN